MLKLSICFFIIMLCGCVGFLKGEKFSERSKLLSDFIEFIEVLNAELKYSGEPIPVILKSVGMRKETEAYKLAVTTAEIYKDSNSTISEAYLKTTKIIYDKLSLNDTDKSIINEVAQYLGRFAIEGQTDLFDLTVKRLNFQLEESLIEEKTKGHIFKSIGIFVGVAIVIILI